MAIYKFRLTFEDYEDISRDIEIRSSQTFQDFLTIILKSIGFDNKHAASFFVSDEYWRKQTEITLLPEDVEDGVKLMKNTRIASCIIQPNQRFILLYDKQVQWSLLIELIKLVKEDTLAEYPRCIKSHGQAPKQYKQKLAAQLKEEAESEAGEDMHADDEAYQAAEKEHHAFDEDEEHSLNEDESEEAQSENEEDGENDGEDFHEENHDED